MKYSPIFKDLLTKGDQLIEIHEFENAVPAELIFTFQKKGDHALYQEIVRLASMQVFPNRIQRSGILIDHKTDTLNEISIHVRYAAKRNQRRYVSSAGEKPFDITK